MLVLLQEGVLPEVLGLAVHLILELDHDGDEVGEVYPILYFLEPVPHLYPLVVDPLHLEVVLQSEDVEAELALRLLQLGLSRVVVLDLHPELVDEVVDVDVLPEAAVPDLIVEGVVLEHGQLVAAAHDGGEVVQVHQHRGVEVGLLLLLGDSEELLVYELLEADPFPGFHVEELFDERAGLLVGD